MATRHDTAHPVTRGRGFADSATRNLRALLASLDRGPALFAAVALTHVVAALVSKVLVGAYQGSPTFWPGNAIVVSALVLFGRRPALWAWVVAGGALAEVCSSIVFGLSPGWALGYAAANVVEIVVVAAFFVRWCPSRDLTTRRGLLTFLVASLGIGPATSAIAGAAVTVADAGVPWQEAYVGWWTGDALGLLLVAGTIIAWSPMTPVHRRSRRIEWIGVPLLVAVLAAVPYVTGFERSASVPILVLLWAAVRLGVRGTLTCGLVFASISEAFTARGIGLWVLESDPIAGQVYLRLFLFAAVLTPWILAVEVSYREAAERRESAERQARRIAEALSGRLATLRGFSEELARATTHGEVDAAWRAHAPGVLGGRGHQLILSGVVLDGAPDGVPAGVVTQRRALATRRPAVSRAGDTGTRTVAAPIAAGEEVFGVLSYEDDGAGPVDQEAAAAVAARLADALVRVRLFTDALQARRRLEILQEVTSTLGRAPTTEAVTRTVLTAVRQAFLASGAGVLLGDRQGRLTRGGTTGPVPVVLMSGPNGLPAPVSLAVTSAAAVESPESEDQPWVVVPLKVAGRVRAVVWFAWDSRDVATDRGTGLLDAVTEQCAAALGRVTASDAEHDAAIKLQQALLPRSFPSVPYLRASARYVPSDEMLSVGGDWYDVVSRPDGRTVVTVGDVVGHDVTAAAAMGQLRSALSAIATEVADPATALERLDRSPDGPGIGFATAVYVDVAADGAGVVLRYSCAGHPPPVLISKGQACFLTDGRSKPLFVSPAPDRTYGEVRTEPGDLLVCYTDGLIERPDRTLYGGMMALARACLVHQGGDLTAFTDGVLADLTAGQSLADDVVLLCLSLGVADQPARVIAPGQGISTPAVSASP